MGILYSTLDFQVEELANGSLVRLSKPSDSESFVEDILVSGISNSIYASNDEGWFRFTTPDGVVEPAYDVSKLKSVQYFYSPVDENINGEKFLCEIVDTFYADNDETAILMHELKQ